MTVDATPPQFALGALAALRRDLEWRVLNRRSRSAASPALIRTAITNYYQWKGEFMTIMRCVVLSNILCGVFAAGCVASPATEDEPLAQTEQALAATTQALERLVTHYAEPALINVGSDDGAATPEMISAALTGDPDRMAAVIAASGTCHAAFTCDRNRFSCGTWSSFVQCGGQFCSTEGCLSPPKCDIDTNPNCRVFALFAQSSQSFSVCWNADRTESCTSWRFRTTLGGCGCE